MSADYDPTLAIYALAAWLSTSVGIWLLWWIAAGLIAGTFEATT